MKHKCYVLAGGESVGNVTQRSLLDGDVIAINKTIMDFPDSKYFITMDFTVTNKINMAKFRDNKKPTKFFVANFVPEYIKEQGGRIFDNRFDLTYDLSPFNIVIKSKNTQGFGYSWNEFAHGNNSGYCGIQLAILMGYKEIYLLGFDNIVKQTHYHGGYGEGVECFETKLNGYKNTLIQSIIRHKLYGKSNKLFNCSTYSYLNQVLPYVEIK